MLNLLKLSQLGGLVDDLANGIAGIIDKYVSLLLNFIYSVLVMPLLLILEIFNMLFRKFAGLGTYIDASSNLELDTDFVYSLITSESVKNVFWAMLILAVILLFIVTFISVIKSEFTAFGDKDGGNNKAKIIKSSFKSLINFAVVPICAILGVLIGNALLKTIDGATGGGDSISLGGKVFIAGAYDANKIRIYTEILLETDGKEGIRLTEEEIELANAIAEEMGYASTFEKLSPEQKLELADKVDAMFENKDSDWAFQWYRLDRVNYYYDLGSFNFVISMVASVGIAIIMLKILIGLIKRIFYLVTLFVIAPPIVAISPLKGDALKEWNKLFISNTIAAYTSILAMNLYFIIIKALRNIEFFKMEYSENRLELLNIAAWGNNIAYVLIIAIGLIFVKDLTKDIGKIIGADSALDVGDGAASKALNTVGQAAMFAATGGAVAGKVLKTTGKIAGKAVGGAAKGLGAGIKKGAVSFRENMKNDALKAKVNSEKKAQGLNDKIDKNNEKRQELDKEYNAYDVKEQELLEKEKTGKLSIDDRITLSAMREGKREVEKKRSALTNKNYSYQKRAERHLTRAKQADDAFYKMMQNDEKAKKVVSTVKEKAKGISTKVSEGIKNTGAKIKTFSNEKIKPVADKTIVPFGNFLKGYGSNLANVSGAGKVAGEVKKGLNSGMPKKKDNKKES